MWIYWGKPGVDLSPTYYLEFHQTNGRIPGSPKDRSAIRSRSATSTATASTTWRSATRIEPKPGTEHDSGTVLVVPGGKGGVDVRRHPAALWLGRRRRRLRQLVRLVPGRRAARGRWRRRPGRRLAADRLAAQLRTRWPRLPVPRPRRARAASTDRRGRARSRRAHPSPTDSRTSNTWFGYSVKAGDFNGDGKIDLAIGIPAKSVSGHALRGGGDRARHRRGSRPRRRGLCGAGDGGRGL